MTFFGKWKVFGWVKAGTNTTNESGEVVARYYTLITMEEHSSGKRRIEVKHYPEMKYHAASPSVNWWKRECQLWAESTIDWKFWDSYKTETNTGFIPNVGKPEHRTITGDSDGTVIKIDKFKKKT